MTTLNPEMPTLWEWIKTHKMQVALIIMILIILWSISLKIFYCPQYNSLIAACNIWGFS